MRGRRRALEGEIERDLSLAWHVAKLMRAKRIPRLATLLSKRGAKAERTGPELIALFERFAKQGATVKITRLKGD